MRFYRPKTQGYRTTLLKSVIFVLLTSVIFTRLRSVTATILRSVPFHFSFISFDMRVPSNRTALRAQQVVPSTKTRTRSPSGKATHKGLPKKQSDYLKIF